MSIMRAVYHITASTAVNTHSMGGRDRRCVCVREIYEKARGSKSQGRIL